MTETGFKIQSNPGSGSGTINKRGSGGICCRVLSSGQNYPRLGRTEFFTARPSRMIHGAADRISTVQRLTDRK
jgi:hypothetical protein